MNLVPLISSILFTLFGIYTCAVLPTKTTPSPPSNLKQLDQSASNVGQEQGRSLPLVTDKELNENVDDQAGDHDKGKKPSVVARKGVSLPDNDNGKVSSDANRNISTDRASTTITKESQSLKSQTSELVSSVKSKTNVTNSDSETSTSYASDKYSPYESKSTKTGTSSSLSSSSSIISSKQDNSSASSDTTKSKSSDTKSSSTESTSSKSSFNKKPLITYSVEDDPTLLNVPRVRQFITPLTPLDVKAEADSAYLDLPPASEIVLDLMPSKREIYIFPLVVMIFLVPMVLGVGIIILRRVRDYWSTRHYRRMDFLVDGMYNT